MKFDKLLFGILFLLTTGCSQGSESATQAPVKDLPTPSGQSVLLQGVQISPATPVAGQALVGVVQSRDMKRLGPLLRYQWNKNGGPVTGETSGTLSGKQFQKGDEITLRVSYLEPTGSEVFIISDPVLIQNTPPVITSMSYSPEAPKSHDEIRAVVQSSDADRDSVDYSFRWFVNDEEIEGEQSESLSKEFTKKGDSVAVEVTPDDGEETGPPLKSFPVQIMNGPPTITSNPPYSVNGEGVYEYHIEAVDPDGDPLQFEVASGPDGMTVDEEQGFLSWKPEEDDIGTHAIEVVAVDSDGAKGIQKYDLEIFLIEAAAR